LPYARGLCLALRLERALQRVCPAEIAAGTVRGRAEQPAGEGVLAHIIERVGATGPGEDGRPQRDLRRQEVAARDLSRTPLTLLSLRVPFDRRMLSPSCTVSMEVVGAVVGDQDHHRGGDLVAGRMLRK
jgi:hypothetical protein